MKTLVRTLAAVLALTIIIPLTQCGKDEPDPINPRDFLYDKWWYNDQGLGNYKFKTGGLYEYETPWGAIVDGQYMWYNDLVDSMKVVQTGGGNWTIWFREITENSFKMSQSNEDHQNIYIYSDTKP